MMEKWFPGLFVLALCWPLTRTTENLALGKPTSQSSTFSDPTVYSADLAVDGNTAQGFLEGSCTHTHEQGFSWWKVDLEAQYLILFVKVYNRAEYGHRLNNFEIRVGNQGDFTKNQLCYAQFEPQDDAEISIFPCTKPLFGRYVSIQKLEMAPGELPSLSLCEVMVFGIEQDVGHVVTSSKLVCGSMCTRNHECMAFSYDTSLGSEKGLCKTEESMHLLDDIFTTQTKDAFYDSYMINDTEIYVKHIKEEIPIFIMW